MSNIIKHCGVMSNTGSRVFVFWRELEGEPDSCLVVYRDSLPDAYTDAVYRFVMSDGQKSVDLYKVAENYGYLLGRDMLTTLHRAGLIKKVKTKDVIMHIGGDNRINLDALNKELNEVSSTESTVTSVVRKDSPFDNFDDSQKFGTDMVSRLIQEAQSHYEQYLDFMTRAKNIDPSITFGEPVTKEGKAESMTLVLPKGISQTKAIEHLKQFLKEQK